MGKPRKAILVSILLLATSGVVTPLRAQMGGGGGGAGGGGGGIPLGGLGKTDDDGPKPEKPNPSERPVTGVVTDADGKPVAGAVVQLTNTKTQKVLSLITHEKGDFRFSGLSKDVNYQLKAVFKDHASETHTLSIYDPRAQPVVNLQIK